MMASFLALYRGETIGAAKLVAATADPELVRDFADRLLTDPDEQEQDFVLQELENGRRRALRLVRNEDE
jgi:hypothetical protein